MSNQDLIVSSFAGKALPADLQLTDGEKTLLIKLLSNSAFFPESFKAWLGSITPMISGDLSVSQVAGFLPLEKLRDFPDDNRKFLRGDGKWVEIASNTGRTWDDDAVAWDDSTYEWDGGA